jgi:hypothetical protein
VSEDKWYLAVMTYDEETGDVKVCMYEEEFVDSIGYENALKLCLKGYIEPPNGLEYDGVDDYIKS